MSSAIAEACFLIGIENYPDMMARIAYSPVLGNADYTKERWPMILFNNHQIVLSPSYYMWMLFNKYRGDEVIPSQVETYLRPTITNGFASVYMFDNCYEMNQVMIDGKPVEQGQILSGNWRISSGILTPVPNRWNYVLLGDSTASDYEFTSHIRRTKGSELIQFRVRNNGCLREQQDYISFTLGDGYARLYHQSGNVTDTLATTVKQPLVNNTDYDVRIRCQKDSIFCYVNEVLVQKAGMRPYPSLASVATLDKKNNCLYLKVVNTTRHEEKAELNIQGLSVEDAVDIIELAGEPETSNTFEKPDRIKPEKKKTTFTMGIPKTYKFPPSSITIMRFKIEK